MSKLVVTANSFVHLDELLDKVYELDENHRKINGQEEVLEVGMYDKNATEEEVYKAAKARYEKRSFFRKALDKLSGKTLNKDNANELGRNTVNDLYR